VLIYSWNVNGLRACAGKGAFTAWLKDSKADIAGLQEVRSLPDQLEPEVAQPKGWKTQFSPAEKKGYSGVGLYSKVAPDELVTSLGKHEFDAEGRFQLARFGKLTIANVYFPNGTGPERDNSRVPYKLAFTKKVFKLLEPWAKAGERILVMGDFNTAHEERDIARPKENAKSSGFLPEERALMSKILKAGWSDTFRVYQPAGGHYSWWSQRGGSRERNVGWRIDYVLASEGAMPFVKAAAIHPTMLGSDHCPISVEVDDGIVG
jgi:exodeoxyribonuclease-3